MWKQALFMVVLKHNFIVVCKKVGQMHLMPVPVKWR